MGIGARVNSQIKIAKNTSACVEGQRVRIENIHTAVLIRDSRVIQSGWINDCPKSILVIDKHVERKNHRCCRRWNSERLAERMCSGTGLVSQGIERAAGRWPHRREPTHWCEGATRDEPSAEAPGLVINTPTCECASRKIPVREQLVGKRAPRDEVTADKKTAQYR